MIKKLADIALNALSWKTSRKLVVITSDDWGSVRVESSESQKKLTEAGFNMTGNRFNKFDILESDSDMSQLFQSLRKFKDYKGNHPVITALTNVANPDFDKIQAHNFTDYFFEPFSTTLKRYSEHSNVLDLYKEGIEANIFVPEFHGREHVHIRRWMELLQSDNKNVKTAFGLKFYAIDRLMLPLNSKSLGAAFDVDSVQDLIDQKNIIESGLHLFEQLFGYKATLFTAPSLQFNTSIQKDLFENGIKLVDVPKMQKMPLENGKLATRFNYNGKKGTAGQKYITRNAVFEPNLTTADAAVQSCINDIQRAFSNKVPAIISNHRAAFVGGIDKENRTVGLLALEDLMEKIIKTWPDVEFISAATLNSIMNND